MVLLIVLQRLAILVSTVDDGDILLFIAVEGAEPDRDKYRGGDDDGHEEREEDETLLPHTLEIFCLNDNRSLVHGAGLIEG